MLCYGERSTDLRAVPQVDLVVLGLQWLKRRNVPICDLVCLNGRTEGVERQISSTRLFDPVPLLHVTAPHIRILHSDHPAHKERRWQAWAAARLHARTTARRLWASLVWTKAILSRNWLVRALQQLVKVWVHVALHVHHLVEARARLVCPILRNPHVQSRFLKRRNRRCLVRVLAVSAYKHRRYRRGRDRDPRYPKAAAILCPPNPHSDDERAHRKEPETTERKYVAGFLILRAIPDQRLSTKSKKNKRRQDAIE
mmetsp:Transcript_93485/g.235478  ORF Transcript_93485/g.235478 Transcript_93485/m.235478 type:complete len:255 (-) Transcript_93485:274-1038(-)